MSTKGFLERLKSNDTILIAEGYLWELERRGFVKCGSYVPEVVIDNPKYLKNLHEEFVLAGSDVVEAYTYYGHREKLKTIGREEVVQKLNRDALRIAREVADTHGVLMAGNISNTWLYVTDGDSAEERMTSLFKEQIEWAVEEGVDYIIGETFGDFREALLALKCIKQYGNGCPAVITLTAYVPDHTVDFVPFPEACRKLEEAGADVVGLNCGRGPATMMPLIREIKKECKGPVAALPVPYRTRDECKSFQSLVDREVGQQAYPLELDTVRCGRSEIREFALDAKAEGIQYIGLCCGNAPYLMREVAEAFNRKPPASNYSPDLSLSIVFGESSRLVYNPAATKIREHIAGKYVSGFH